MKFIKSLTISCLLVVAALSLPACGGNKASDTQGKEYTSAYVCPMHCTGSGSAEMGTCPVCKMDLKKIEVASNDEVKEEEIE